jgi:hypothetical protein
MISNGNSDFRKTCEPFLDAVEDRNDSIAFIVRNAGAGNGFISGTASLKKTSGAPSGRSRGIANHGI